MKNKLEKERKKELRSFQKEVKIKFKNLQMLDQALTHSSYAHERYNNENHNEKFEFLGDSVLSLFIVEYLYTKFNNLREGELSKLKSYIVSEEVLYKISMKINLNKYLLLGKGEERTGGRFKKSLSSNAMEALIGAYYLDSGIKKCCKLVLNLFREIMEFNRTFPEILDYKSELQKETQKLYKRNPEYYLIHTKGPDHDKTFQIGVRVKTNELGKGTGPNKQSAEKEAAKNALDTLL